MKTIVALVIIIAFFAVPCAIRADENAKVLLIAREVSEDMTFMIRNEVFPMIDLLKKGNCDVSVATESGLPIIAGEEKLIPDLKLDDVHLADYTGIIIPCMACGSMKNSVPKASIAILKEAAAAGIPIAAQNALEMIDAAGLRKGKKVSTWVGVVQDGNLITSYNCPYMSHANGKPIDTPQLVAAFIKALAMQ